MPASTMNTAQWENPAQFGISQAFGETECLLHPLALYDIMKAQKHTGSGKRQVSLRKPPFGLPAVWEREVYMTGRRWLCMLLALVLVLCLAACGEIGNNSHGSGNSSGGNQFNETGSVNNGSSAAAGSSAPVIPGKLYQLGASDGETPVITALTLTGNAAGTDDDINGLTPGTEGIRCVFELNEYISMYPTAKIEDVETLSVYLIAHDGSAKNDMDYFSAKLTNELPHSASEVTEDMSFGSWAWWDIRLDPAYLEPGYYDLVFLKDATPTAFMLLKIYPEGELNLSPGALVKLMDEVIADAEGSIQSEQ